MTQHNAQIVKTLRASGERMTPIRMELLNILSKSTEPRSPQELRARLEKKGFSANKTTVYRQLEMLERYGIVQSVQFADRTRRYELVSESGHHHHLVCVHCERVEDISFPTELEEQEKLIWKQHRFTVLQHSLEFFGVCRRCRAEKPILKPRL